MWWKKCASLAGEEKNDQCECAARSFSKFFFFPNRYSFLSVCVVCACVMKFKWRDILAGVRCLTMNVSMIRFEANTRRHRVKYIVAFFM